MQQPTTAPDLAIAADGRRRQLDMNHLSLRTCNTLLLFACASAPVGCCTKDPVGLYRMQKGPELWEELDIRPDGLFTRWSCTSHPFPSKASVAGRWRIESDEIVFRTDHATTRLFLRHCQGHVYLVPAAHVDWFDDHGPYDELCFSSDGAPLLYSPP